MATDNVTSMRQVATSVHEAEDRLRREYADIAALCRGNMRAALASGQAAVCGVHEITGAVLAFLQSRAKDSLAAGAELAACDSAEAALEIQIEHTKAMVQTWSDDLARLNALTGRIFADVVAPIGDRAGIASSGQATGSGNSAGALAA